jgi:hypothetical protein
MTMSDCMIWYIGEEGRGLMNIQMQNADAAVNCSADIASRIS